MPISTPRRRRHLAVGVLLASAAVLLASCGQRGTPADPSTPPSLSPSPVTSAASPYVEPGAGDGAPHYNDNNAHRRPGDMSAAGERDAEKEAARIDPVLKRLWKQGDWDPETVLSAMLALGYEEKRTGPKGERLGGQLDVRPLESRYETDHYVTPEGTRIGLRVQEDACVTAFVQKSNYSVSVNGPYMETGCFRPPFAH
ncbi:hypothetical protein ACFQ7W_23940 [Streptomyces niveus]|uniref:hypothetical protein n=1 Tax=Streptomyces niveus TaxID=193462 RepID=UPI0036C4B5DD